MSEKIPARFRKTKNDKWAVMAPFDDLERALAEGGKIEVQRRSGDWTTFTVASLGRPFDVDGVQMCYGYGPDDDAGADQTSGAGGAAAPDQAAPSPSGRAASSERGRPGSGRSATGRSGGGSGPGSTGAQGPSRGGARRRPAPEPPPRDDHEPLPVYQGGAEDEWTGDY